MDNDEIIAKLRASPPREICEHGSQKVKCVHCDNDVLEARVRELEAKNSLLKWDREKIHTFRISESKRASEFSALLLGLESKNRELEAALTLAMPDWQESDDLLARTQRSCDAHNRMRDDIATYQADCKDLKEKVAELESNEPVGNDYFAGRLAECLDLSPTPEAMGPFLKACCELRECNSDLEKTADYLRERLEGFKKMVRGL